MASEGCQVFLFEDEAGCMFISGGEDQGGSLCGGEFFF